MAHTMTDTAFKPELVCANCQEPDGKAACSGCLLVVYCGKDCEKEHWNTHKATCKSPLMKESWQPGWVVENRTPAFVGDGPSQSPFGGKKYLWGNIPAFDVCRLLENEGDAYDKELNFVFAASGDLRNVVKTVANLPSGYEKPIALVINDIDMDVVARNVFMLLILLTLDDEAQAVEAVVHLWYSALMRSSDINLLATHVRPLIEDVVTKVRNKPMGVISGKTWQFGHCTLRVEMSTQRWMALPYYLDAPTRLSSFRANEIRRSVILAPSRSDYRDRKMITDTPTQRVCGMNFREDGVLLPFGESRKDFKYPNPTLFSTDEWPIKDAADPLDGWPQAEVTKVDSGPATNDLYGKLYFYVRNMLICFRRRLEKTCHIHLISVDARHLPGRITQTKFDRIEVANISDGGYLGIHNTMACLGSMLREPEQNPHATLITLFMNAVKEIEGSTPDRQAVEGQMNRAVAYLGPPVRPPSPADAYGIMLIAALTLVCDMEKAFDKYMKRHNFKQTEWAFDVTMKKSHTIIEQWPLRCKLQPGQKGAKEEFKALMSSGHSGIERYVEWKRTR